MAELVGNKAIEDAAVAWVVEIERAASRNSRDTRFGAALDVLRPLGLATNILRVALVGNARLVSGGHARDLHVVRPRLEGPVI